ncbi:hypothetical protein ASG36_03305 [Geodermatophilus sp. Leaf369]|uniref:ANTAR domain-containing protein n=1 Tax=Geodermatophilus sp. Leaf369 TaxID=1736354 RepID=UPI0006F2F779|nr:ANTAR domain-containing protein [Geodermatophilus sp. Leaf369]KQS60047.1 hypothetical protein ASG36_03305 [Geodermatophilus sp. Leaf369]
MSDLPGSHTPLGLAARLVPAEPGAATGAVYADVVTALGELDVAQEELRVADEALRDQQSTLTALVAAHQAEERWRDRVTALLPAGTFDTDAQGVVLRADARVASLAGRDAGRLVGKPFVVLLPPRSRTPWRSALTRLARGAEEVRVTVHLDPGDRPGTTVEAVGLAESLPDSPRVRWVLLPAPTAPAASVSERSSGTPRPAGVDVTVAEAVARLCLLPLGVLDSQRLLTEVARIVRDAVPGATAASVTLGTPAAPSRLAADSSTAQQVDGLQLREGEGPCVSAQATSVPAVSADLAVDVRWPALAAAMRGHEVHSALALPLVGRGERVGVLNVYGTDQGAFDEHAVLVGGLVAAAVTAVLQDVEEKLALQTTTGNLEEALRSRAVIEQAKGIVMAHHGGSPDEAFARLVKLSNQHNVKVRDLAGLLVEGGAASGLRPWMSEPG